MYRSSSPIILTLTIIDVVACSLCEWTELNRKATCRYEVIGRQIYENDLFGEVKKVCSLHSTQIMHVHRMVVCIEMICT